MFQRVNTLSILEDYRLEISLLNYAIGGGEYRALRSIHIIPGKRFLVPLPPIPILKSLGRPHNPDCRTAQLLLLLKVCMQGKLHEVFCKRIFGVPSTAANGACVTELGKTSRRERVVERIIKCWKRLWEMGEKSLLGEALKQQTIERGENWLKKLEQELNRLGKGNVWRRGEENNNNVWNVVSKRCIDIERQKMEANMTEKDL
jgi:hypothetical protein